jgi:hypothetical protein
VAVPQVSGLHHRYERIAASAIEFSATTLTLLRAPAGDGTACFIRSSHSQNKMIIKS